jgi:hypothetical protein
LAGATSKALRLVCASLVLYLWHGDDAPSLLLLSF